jgi:hypothetical protein
MDSVSLRADPNIKNQNKMDVCLDRPIGDALTPPKASRLVSVVSCSSFPLLSATMSTTRMQHFDEFTAIAHGDKLQLLYDQV